VRKGIKEIREIQDYLDNKGLKVKMEKLPLLEL
jgi:hypothetical protein